MVLVMAPVRGLVPDRMSESGAFDGSADGFCNTSARWFLRLFSDVSSAVSSKALAMAPGTVSTLNQKSDSS